VEDSPLKMDCGEAEIETADCKATLTDAVAVTVPPGPVAVSVYVVVWVGETVFEPEACAAPTPLSIWTEVAFVTVQDRVEFCPAAMEAGLAVRVAVGASVPVMVNDAVAVTEPPGPVAVSV